MHAQTNAPADAIELLKADHREAEALFAKFEAARTGPSKRKIAEEVCNALVLHTRLEEELFYPACKRAGVESDLLKEAQVEHDSAKQLIEEILDGSPTESLYEAKVKVLSEQIEHHVSEEEGRNGIFAQAKKKGIDLDALGEKLAARKAELEKAAAKR
jgi:hypothetical protein